MQIDLKSLTKELQPNISKYNLKLVYLFGSFADNSQTPKSDLDLAILPYHSFSSKDFLELYTELLPIIKGKFGIDLDLVNLNRASSLLKREVVTKGKLIFGDELNAAKYYVAAINQYIDEKPLRDQIREYALS